MRDDIGAWLEETGRRQRILTQLLPALKEAEGTRGILSLGYAPEEEMAVAAFADGREVWISVAGDSDMAMIYDVVVKLWRPY